MTVRHRYTCTWLDGFRVVLFATQETDARELGWLFDRLREMHGSVAS